MIADVLIFRGVDTFYSYSVPSTLLVSVGQSVKVPLGRYAVSGVVMKLHNQHPEGITLKPIIGLDEKKPVLTENLVELIIWLSAYYHTTPYKAYQTIVSQKRPRILTTTPPQLIYNPPQYTLNADQLLAIDTIKNSKDSCFYLFGITGSGKTEVYMQLAYQCQLNNQGVLILVPEIALTPQFTTVFSSRFGDIISVIHSGLTAKEKDIEWQRIKDGHATIVIGPRSAIFAPVKQLGLIVVDEEHEPTYKQDTHPRYDAKVIAEHRRGVCQATLIYGSATPSIETFSRTSSNNPSRFSNIHLLRLDYRATGQLLPSVDIIDMKKVFESGHKELISPQLMTLIQDRIHKKEKVMILLNRRGYAPYVACQKCGNVHVCTECKLSYTYHRDKFFRCHRCDITAPITNTCPTCKSNQLAFTGAGTQKIELMLRRTFPDASILRLDKDSAKKSNDIDALLTQFKQSGDVLIGTQLIAKGHHIESVTLVGVLGVDTLLNMPDFRSAERSFQLVTQVAGRAGRGKKLGHVIVQTVHPEHFALQHARGHHYEDFYQEEMSYRRPFDYPPYRTLINIIFSSTSQTELTKTTNRYQKWFEGFKTDYHEHIQIIGPKPAPFEFIRNHYRWNCLLKIDHAFAKSLKQKLAQLPSAKKEVRVMIDFDPFNIL